MKHCRRPSVLAAVLAAALFTAGPPLAAQGAAAANPQVPLTIPEMRQASEAHPDDAFLHLRLARAIHESEGPTEEAIRHFERALSLAPEQKETHHFYGVALLDLNRLQEAEIQLGLALKLDPSDESVHLRWARVLQRLGQTERSIAELKKILATDPGNGKVLIALATAYSAAGDSKTAGETLEKVLQANPDLSDATLAHLELAKLRADQGDLAGSIEHDRAVIKLRPRYLQSQRRLAESSVKLAAERAKARDLRAALEPLEAALDVVTDPIPRSRLLFNDAVVQQQLGDDPKALDLYREALELDHDYHDAHYNLGFALGKSGQLDQAAQHFRRAIDLDHGDALAYVGLATAQQASKRFAEALQTLKEGLAKLPEDPRLNLALARLLAGAEPSLRDPAAALAAAEKANRGQATAESVELLAQLLAANGRFSDAASWQQRLVTEAEKAGAPPAVLDRLRQNLARYQANQPAP